MRGINKVFLIGNTGKDPELRYTQSGVAVATFSLAINSSWKGDDGERKEHTEWVNCVAWRKSAEVLGEYVKKGSKLWVEGRMQTRKYDDKNGVTRWTTEVVVENFTMLDKKPNGAAPPAHEQEPEAPASKESDDLPF